MSLAGLGLRHDEVETLFNHVVETLRAQGAIIVDPAEIPTRGKYDDDEQTVLMYEFKDGINRYLANRGATPRTLADLIVFNNNEHVREMPIFQQELFISAQAKGPLTDKEYIEARERSKKLAGTEGIDAALAKDQLDVLIAPPSVPPGRPIGSTAITSWVATCRARRRLQVIRTSRCPWDWCAGYRWVCRLWERRGASQS